MSKKEKLDIKKFKFTTVRVIVFILLSSILAVMGFCFKTQIEGLFNKNSYISVVDYNGLVMHTIDVGQAEAIMIKLPDNKNMLIDSGERGETRNEQLKSYLNNNYFNLTDNDKIDYFLLTHSDSDHCGGAVMIFENYEVNKVFRPNIFSSKVASENDIVTNYNKKFIDTTIWGNVITSMYNEPNCEVEFSKAGIEIIENNYSIKFYSPNENNYENVNTYSPVIVIEYNSKKIMLTGDATIETEEEVLNKIPNCDVLKVAHHGSSSSSCEEFLEKVNPSYAIISCNKDDGNNYNHPHQEVINRLLNYMTESNIYRTDLNGNIILNITQTGAVGFLTDVLNVSFYIKAEYVILAGVAILFVICFTIFNNKAKN